MTEGISRRMLWKCKPGQGGGRGMEIYCKAIAPMGREGVCLGMFRRTGAQWAGRSQSMMNHLEDLMVLRSLDLGPTSDIILSF